VADRDTKAPFDPDRRIAARIKAAAFDAGLVCYPMAGTVDGRSGDHILLAPPFIMTEDELDELVDKLGRAFDAVL
jgi:adenosylmethionine-8-amino-7-oxononanoate aminotransferase